MKNYKKWEGGVGPCDTHLDFLSGTYLLAALSFLRQAL